VFTTPTPPTSSATAPSPSSRPVNASSALLGQYRQSLADSHGALTLLRTLDNQDGQAHTLRSLGYAYLHLGEHAEAAGHFRESVALFRALSDTYHEADTLQMLGHVGGVDGCGQSRYEMHDLLRIFAAEQADAEDAADVTTAAVTRVVEGWLFLVDAIMAGRPEAGEVVRVPTRAIVTMRTRHESLGTQFREGGSSPNMAGRSSRVTPSLP
jgi:tetratricopeptide repeat protein